MRQRVQPALSINRQSTREWERRTAFPVSAQPAKDASHAENQTYSVLFLCGCCSDKRYPRRRPERKFARRALSRADEVPSHMGRRRGLVHAKSRTRPQPKAPQRSPTLLQAGWGAVGRAHSAEIPDCSADSSHHLSARKPREERFQRFHFLFDFTHGCASGHESADKGGQLLIPAGQSKLCGKILSVQLTYSRPRGQPLAKRKAWRCKAHAHPARSSGVAHHVRDLADAQQLSLLHDRE